MTQLFSFIFIADSTATIEKTENLLTLVGKSPLNDMEVISKGGGECKSDEFHNLFN